MMPCQHRVSSRPMPGKATLPLRPGVNPPTPSRPPRRGGAWIGRCGWACGLWGPANRRGTRPTLPPPRPPSRQGSCLDTGDIARAGGVYRGSVG